jgi:4-diphosphocytidyl-2-C-methyl-D-erythritol kinase
MGGARARGRDVDVKIEMRAAAKLTLSLRVLGTRPDGYHDLEALVVNVTEPHDLLTARCEGSGLRLHVTGPALAGVPDDDTNLVSRAVDALAAIAPRARDVDIVVAKSIPPGAGLGGGSADAAAVLRTLGRRWKVSFDDVMRIGAEIGSDVPACIRGGAVWMRGRGEQVSATRLPTLRTMVVVPGFAVSTADVYQAYDELDGSTSPRVVPAPSGVAAVLPPLLNDLEVAAEHVEPRLREFRRELEAASGLPPLLAGSGSAYIMLCGDETEWRKHAARVEQTLGLPVHSALSLQPYPVW